MSPSADRRACPRSTPCSPARFVSIPELKPATSAKMPDRHDRHRDQQLDEPDSRFFTDASSHAAVNPSTGESRGHRLSDSRRHARGRPSAAPRRASRRARCRRRSSPSAAAFGSRSSAPRRRRGRCADSGREPLGVGAADPRLDRGDDDDPAAPRDGARRRRAEHDLLREGRRRRPPAPSWATRPRRSASRHRALSWKGSCVPAGAATLTGRGIVVGQRAAGKRIGRACVSDCSSTLGVELLRVRRRGRAWEPEQPSGCSVRANRSSMPRALDHQQNGEHAETDESEDLLPPLLGGAALGAAASAPWCWRDVALTPPAASEAGSAATPVECLAASTGRGDGAAEDERRHGQRRLDQPAARGPCLAPENWIESTPNSRPEARTLSSCELGPAPQEPEELADREVAPFDRDVHRHHVGAPPEATGCGRDPDDPHPRTSPRPCESWRRICDIRTSSGIAVRSVASCGRALAEHRAVDQRLRRLELELGVVDLRRELGRLRPLRRDDAEPADEQDEQEADRGDPDGRSSVEALDHHRPPVGPSVAAIVNWTRGVLAPAPRALDWSVTSVSQGSSASRSSTCATRTCESAEPVTVKPVGAPPVLAGAAAVAARRQ